MKNIVCCDDYADLKKKSFVSLGTRRHIALSLSRMYEVTSSIVTPSWTSCQFITGYTTLPPPPRPRISSGFPNILRTHFTQPLYEPDYKIMYYLHKSSC